MYEVGDGRPILWHTLTGLVKVGLTEFILVVCSQNEFVQSYFGDGRKIGAKIDYAVQPKPLGTGDAILRARAWLSPGRNFFVFNGSQIYGSRVALREGRALKLLSERVVLFGQKTATPSQYGIMELHHGRVIHITEKPKEDKGNIRILGFYALPLWFLEELEKFTGDESLEQALISVLDKRGGMSGILLPEEMIFPSLKFPWDLLEMNRIVMDAWSVKGIEKEEGAEIHSSALICGPVIIRRGAKILEGAVVKGPCFIDVGAIAGTHSLVRDHCYIGKGVVVGAGSEVRNSLLYEETHLHRNFVGDSILDHGCRLGAGTITANTKLKNAKHKQIRSAVGGEMTDTGRTKLGVTAGTNSSLGINVSVFPGIKIGRQVQIWPGTVVVSDIPDDCLCRSADTNVFIPRRRS